MFHLHQGSIMSALIDVNTSLLVLHILIRMHLKELAWEY